MTELSRTQLEARQIEGERTEVDHLLLGTRLGAPEDRRDAQQQLTRLERLDQIVVGAALEPGDPIVRLASGGQQQDRDVAGEAQAPCQRHAVLVGQHHVEHDQVESEAIQLRFGLRLRRRHC